MKRTYVPSVKETARQTIGTQTRVLYIICCFFGGVIGYTYNPKEGVVIGILVGAAAATVLAIINVQYFVNKKPRDFGSLN